MVSLYHYTKHNENTAINAECLGDRDARDQNYTQHKSHYNYHIAT